MRRAKPALALQRQVSSTTSWRRRRRPPCLRARETWAGGAALARTKKGNNTQQQNDTQNHRRRASSLFFSRGHLASTRSPAARHGPSPGRPGGGGSSPPNRLDSNFSCRSPSWQARPRGTRPPAARRRPFGGIHSVRRAAGGGLGWAAGDGRGRFRAEATPHLYFERGCACRQAPRADGEAAARQHRLVHCGSALRSPPPAHPRTASASAAAASAERGSDALDELEAQSVPSPDAPREQGV